MTTAKKTTAKKRGSAPLKRQLKEFNQLLAQIRAQVQEERERGPGFQEELTAKLDQARSALAAMQKKIASAKSQCAKRKTEIDEWKAWYHGLAQIEKSAELLQLNQEIAWRGAEIASQEAVISELYRQLIQVEGEIEQARIRLESLSRVDWDAPMEDDPRITSLLEERDLLETKIVQLK